MNLIGRLLTIERKIRAVHKHLVPIFAGDDRKNAIAQYQFKNGKKIDALKDEYVWIICNMPRPIQTLEDLCTCKHE